MSAAATQSGSVPNICRRCKKKRSADETEETLKYRTCKPCREIERKKKRLKKLERLSLMGNNAAHDLNQYNPAPVTEHGQVSDPRQDAIHEKIINIANQASLQSQQQTYERQAETTQTPDQHQHLAHKDENKDIPIDESLLREGQSNDQSGLPPVKDDKDQNKDSSENKTEDQKSNAAAAADFANDTKNIFAAIQNAGLISSENKDPNADYCLYCGVLRDVNDNGRYKLCGNCVDNPLESNVFNDFGEYLGRINSGKYTDLKNLIFLKRFESNDIIPNIEIYEDQQNNLNSIMENLTNNFISPVISASGFKFSKGSSNLSAKPFPKAIKVLYKCKQDVKTTQRSSNSNGTNNNATSPTIQNNIDPQSQATNSRKMKTENCNSNMYVSYDIYGRTLNIKYNHNTHKTYIEKLYSNELIDTVRSYLTTEGDLERIFDQLNSTTSNGPSDPVKLEIGGLKKANFVRDFSNLL